MIGRRDGAAIGTNHARGAHRTLRSDTPTPGISDRTSPPFRIRIVADVPALVPT
jgi:hypothetical protein